MLLSGISQGGSISLFTMLTSDIPVAGLATLSSYLVLGEKIATLVPADSPNKNLPVWMGHGKEDPLIRFEWAQMTRDKVRELGWKVDFHAYEDCVHTAVPEEIEDLERYIAERLPPLESSGAGAASSSKA